MPFAAASAVDVAMGFLPVGVSRPHPLPRPTLPRLDSGAPARPPVCHSGDLDTTALVAYAEDLGTRRGWPRRYSVASRRPDSTCRMDATPQLRRAYPWRTRPSCSA
jgi:hypothetical protein